MVSPQDMSTETVSLSSLSLEKNVESAQLHHSVEPSNGAKASGNGNSSLAGIGMGIIFLVILFIVILIIIEIGKPKFCLRIRDCDSKSSKGKCKDTSDDDDVCLDNCVVDHWRAVVCAIVATFVFLLLLALALAVLGSFGWGTIKAARGK